MAGRPCGTLQGSPLVSVQFFRITKGEGTSGDQSSYTSGHLVKRSIASRTWWFPWSVARKRSRMSTPIYCCRGACEHHQCWSLLGSTRVPHMKSDEMKSSPGALEQTRGETGILYWLMLFCITPEVKQWISIMKEVGVLLPLPTLKTMLSVTICSYGNVGM